MKTNSLKSHLALHSLYFFYAIILVLMKLLNAQLSGFYLIIGFGLILLLLMIYTFFWQKILEKFNLSYAYLNKAMVLVWSTLFGSLIFHEKISINHIFGLSLILMGLLLISRGQTHE